MPAARVSSKGQVVIPVEMRSHLGWKRGASVNVQETPHGVFIFKVPKSPLRELRGVLKGFGITKADVKSWREEDERHDISEIRSL
jgi:AbrB family looped-hinge helix DNA binding protein